MIKLYGSVFALAGIYLWAIIEGGALANFITVSYTHLTLPTILLV